MSLIGIDFGTLSVRAAHFGVKGAPELIRDPGYPESTALMPSLVTFHEDGGVSVGWDAKKRRQLFPLSTISAIKRRIYNPETPSLAAGEFLTLPEGKLGGVEKISNILFKEIKRRVEDSIRTGCGGTVLSVPQCFDETKKKFLKEKMKSAGFDLLGLIQDSSAAALACAFLEKKAGKTAVFSMGAGFFEFSIFELKDKGLRLLASGGHMLGGMDIDWRITQNIFSELEMNTSHPVKGDPFLVQKVLEESEKAKWALSHRGSYDFQITDAPCAVQFTRAFSRFEMTEWAHDLVERTIEICEHVVKASGLKHSEIDEIVLAGGMTRMPLVQETIEKTFRKKPFVEANPDLTVAFGASIYAEMLSGQIPDWNLEL